jgi:cysteine desulfurase
MLIIIMVLIILILLMFFCLGCEHNVFSNIYLDNAATTEVSQEVQTSYIKHIKVGNCNGFYQQNWTQHTDQIIKSNLPVETKIIYGSGATEANANVVHSIIANKPKPHVICSFFEHANHLNNLKMLAANNQIDLTMIDPANINNILEQVKPNTTLISIICVNNELGICSSHVIQELKARLPLITIHTDITQALMKTKLPVADIYTASFHKIHGLQGIGFIATINDQPFKQHPLIYGKPLEPRGGTCNLPAIISSQHCFSYKYSQSYIKELKLYAINILRQHVPGILFAEELRPEYKYSSYILAAFIPNICSKLLQQYLYKHKLVIGIGSACSKDQTPVTIKALELDPTGYIRISFAETNKKHHIYKLATLINQFIKGQ